MHRVFQNFIDRLSSAQDAEGLHAALTETSAALDLSCFAYLVVPNDQGSIARLISNYPAAWTKHYLQKHYERFDPVIIRALARSEPFEWGLGLEPRILSEKHRELFEEAAKFGINYGFTIPIHDHFGPVAAVTFATDVRNPQFQRSIKKHARVLQLMAMYFHAQARLTVDRERKADFASLSPREAECLEWSAEGKSAWEIGCILGISRHTVTTYLENAKAKLGVRTIVQAVARLTAFKSIKR